MTRAASEAGVDSPVPAATATALQWASVPWLEAPRARVVAARRDGRLPHALLIHGTEGGGQLPLAVWIAHWLLCGKGGDAPCGTCPSCQLFLAGTHPDFHWVGIEPEASQIKIDQVRELCGKLTLRSYRGAAKVGLIEPAEVMNAHSFNALLKTLEEPPEDTLLLLATARLDRLPATVVSRCQRLYVAQPHAAEALRWLDGATAREDWPSLLAIAGGAPLAALRLAGTGAGELAAEMSQALGAGRRAFDPLVLAAAWCKDRPGERLAWLECWLDAAVRSGSGLSDGVNNNRDNSLPSRAGELNIRAAFLLLDRVREARALLEGSLNTQLLFEDLLTSFGEALAGRTVGRPGGQA